MQMEPDRSKKQVFQPQVSKHFMLLKALIGTENYKVKKENSSILPRPFHVCHMMHDDDMMLGQTAFSDSSVYPLVWSLKTQAV